MSYQLQALNKEEQFSLTPAIVVSIHIFTYVFHTMTNTVPFWLNLLLIISLEGKSVFLRIKQFMETPSLPLIQGFYKFYKSHGLTRF